MNFDTRENVIEWIIRNQFGRRNITDFVKAELALRLEDVIKARAKENKSDAMAKARKHNPNNAFEQLCPKSNPTVNTLQELATIAGVGKNTIWKAKVIKNEGGEEKINPLSDF